MAKLLVIAETDGSRVLASTAQALTFAQQWAAATGGAFDLLVIGSSIDAAEWTGFGVATIYTASHPDLAHPAASQVAAVCAEAVRASGAESVAGPASSFGRDVLPRVAGLLDLPMLSDVMSVTSEDGGLQFRRPMYAGNIIATVKVESDRGVFSVRGTAFGAPERSGATSAIQELSTPELPAGTTWVSLEGGEQKRPDLTGARVVVSGGRPLRDAETFERLLGGLADKLGGAVGATRAAVDSGIAPNELQVGQTGKVVAPELYIAAGVSGSVQHLAGMKDSKVIVAINTDPEAPIFEVADYGLVQDLHTALPELIQKL
jgi:electron transfer flavoprotein alpha subunit